jgi:uncharacterized membrane protein
MNKTNILIGTSGIIIIMFGGCVIGLTLPITIAIAMVYISLQLIAIAKKNKEKSCKKS